MTLTDNLAGLQEFLKEKAWLQAGEVLEGSEKPGDGNMNFTLRVKTNQRTFILKQSRGYVEKYPQVKAPAARALMEAAFYERIAAVPKLKGRMPEILAVDREHHVLLMEDLGEGKDFTFLYQKEAHLTDQELQELVDYLCTLHQLKAATAPNRIRNAEMRQLNHQHIFVLPFSADNGFDLDSILPGLQAASLPIKQDAQLKKTVEALGNLYLSDGDTLLHGDFFPGSWLKTPGGIKIIDPEFCFYGAVEFEVGVSLAHFKMSEQSAETQAAWLSQYARSNALDQALAEKFAAVELIRRIIGLAQLPLHLSLEERIRLLEEACTILKK